MWHKHFSVGGGRGGGGGASCAAGGLMVTPRSIRGGKDRLRFSVFGSFSHSSLSPVFFFFAHQLAWVRRLLCHTRKRMMANNLWQGGWSGGVVLPVALTFWTLGNRCNRVEFFFLRFADLQWKK